MEKKKFTLAYVRSFDGHVKADVRVDIEHTDRMTFRELGDLLGEPSALFTEHLQCEPGRYRMTNFWKESRGCLEVYIAEEAIVQLVPDNLDRMEQRLEYAGHVKLGKGLCHKGRKVDGTVRRYELTATEDRTSLRLGVDDWDFVIPSAIRVDPGEHVRLYSIHGFQEKGRTDAGGYEYFGVDAMRLEKGQLVKFHEAIKFD
ncbi:MAG: hypothetical protein ABIH41_03255 [Nanoarchaeota archaeon]